MENEKGLLLSKNSRWGVRFECSLWGAMSGAGKGPCIGTESECCLPSGDGGDFRLILVGGLGEVAATDEALIDLGGLPEVLPSVLVGVGVGYEVEPD